MREKKTQIKVILKLIIVIIFASLYSWGGMEMKWLRRFLAPAILCLSAYGFSRDWRYLVQMPFMFLSLSIGYGGENLWVKVAKRFIYGLTNGFTCSIRSIWIAAKENKKLWWVVGFQVLLLTSGYTIFGVINPLPSARAEEAFLGALIALLVMMSCPDKKKFEK